MDNVQSTMASAYDVLPTLLDYLGLPLPNTNLGTIAAASTKGSYRWSRQRCYL